MAHIGLSVGLGIAIAVSGLTLLVHWLAIAAG